MFNLFTYFYLSGVLTFLVCLFFFDDRQMTFAGAMLRLAGIILWPLTLCWYIAMSYLKSPTR